MLQLNLNPIIYFLNEKNKMVKTTNEILDEI